MNKIENYKKKLKSNGYVLIKDFFNIDVEFINLKNFLQKFIKFTLNTKNIKMLMKF